MRRLKSPRAYARLSWLACLACATTAATENPPCEDWAQIVSLQGATEARRADSAEWHRARLHDYYCPGDTLRVLRRSRAALLLRGETIVRLDQLSALTLLASREPGRRWLDLLSGIAHFISRVPRSLDVKTPYVNAAIEGTEFLVRIGTDQTLLTVYEGLVRASNAAGEVGIGAGETVAVAPGQAPAPYALVRPRDAVQWTIYYPPLVYYRPEQLADHPAMQRALDSQRRGDIDAAVEALSGSDDPRVLTYRAALQLSVGRADTARADLERALARAPDDSDAFALSSMLATTRDDRAEGMRLAQAAVNAATPSPAAWLALSYARQAAFDLDGAHSSAGRAVAAAPESALAHARLAEMALSLGDLDGALAASDAAVTHDPSLARTHMVLGFAHLARIETAAAAAAFERAIALDSADPLSRLGLGLARIRDGDLAGGRLNIEIAASLDPANSLVRSYLGKAYYEERRDRLASDQLALAKQLDPNDPTPWFYDAIRKQTENRPIEALQDLRRSIALNDHRAVYRSRLLLDEDLAARSTNLARIYRDLGFEQRALVEGWASLSTDPSNYSAHRLLADAYAALPRHEIARASELLQAQLLQPLNLTPIQPQSAETSLTILEGAGPARAGFGEYSPLFTRNRTSFEASGIAGNHDTQGNHIVLAGLYNWISASVGTFHYTTDGFRRNNDLHDDVRNAFVQAAVTPTLNIQAEVRRRDRARGDLDLNFDPANFSDRERETVHQETSRLGLRWAVTPRSDILLSWINSRIDATTMLASPGSPIITNPVVETGNQAELLYLARSARLNMAIGAGTYHTDADERTQFDWTPVFPVPCPAFPPVPCSERNTFKNIDRTAYVYTDFLLANALTATLGASLDSIEIETLDRSEINPKLGMQWRISNDVRLRAAYFETVKRPLVVNQSLEPTQVAGFNQFFDDSNASITRRSGLGLDANFGTTIYGGLEFSRRDVERPQFGANTVSFANREEELNRAYLDWVIGMRWTLAAEYQFEKIRSEDLGPPRLDTTAVPIFARYFSPRGYFAKLGATFVSQNVTLPPGSSFDRTHEDFTVLDVGVGYRFPKRAGSVSLEVRNLRDKEFLYQDLNYTSAHPVTPRFIPDRLVFGHFILNF